jgi:glycosyltransferase involved in cell wall biosynthesis
MLVGQKFSDDSNVIAPVSKWGRGVSLIRPTLDDLPLSIYRKRKGTIFSPAFLPERLSARIDSIRPDIIHLHWVCGGFLRIETLRRFKKPIIWTLHDMWAFTGGCHYDESCGRYKNECGSCPQLNSKSYKDLSHRTWKRKRNAWKGLDLIVVTPSRWLADCAMESSLFQKFRIEVIPNGLDTNHYKPVDKKKSREILGLPQDKKLILFGALNASSDRRKGFQYLQPTLQRLAKNGWVEKVELIVFGASRPTNPPDLGLISNYTGRLYDDASLVLLYNAADLFVAPSVQENLPNTIMESLACGTPVVAFNVGGIPEMIGHKKNGYLAKPYEADDLAKGIGWILENPERSKRLGNAAREKAVREYSLELQARQYLNLYEEILKKNP